MKDPKKYLPPAPPAYGTNEAKRAIYHQILVNATLTERQKALAEHWQYPGSSSSSIPRSGPPTSPSGTGTPSTRT